jgi:transcriptional regulator with XRE-family HTH domain
VITLDLGKAIKLVRTAAGMRQGAVAKQVGVSANYLSLIENGKREPSVSFLRKLASALGVPVGIFFWQEGDSTKPGGPQLDTLRELLTRLEVVYLQNSRKKRAKKRAA